MKRWEEDHKPHLLHHNQMLWLQSSEGGDNLENKTLEARAKGSQTNTPMLNATTVKPEGKTDEEWEFDHEQVCSFIRQFVEDNVYNHICNETHARSLWNKLEMLYSSKTGNNKLFYLTKLVQVKYKEVTSLPDHLNEMERI